MIEDFLKTVIAFEGFFRRPHTFYLSTELDKSLDFSATVHYAVNKKLIKSMSKTESIPGFYISNEKSSSVLILQ
jgi:hypothetical protein